MILTRDIGQPRVLQQSRLARRAALRCRFVRDDQTLATLHQPDPAHDPRAWDLALHPKSRQRRDLQKIRSLVEQRLDPFARQQLPFRLVPLAVFRSAAFGRSLQLQAQPVNRLGHPRIVRAINFRVRIDNGRKRQASYSTAFIIIASALE
jgi:hypothetical protein